MKCFLLKEKKLISFGNLNQIFYLFHFVCFSIIFNYYNIFFYYFLQVFFIFNGQIHIELCEFEISPAFRWILHGI